MKYNSMNEKLKNQDIQKLSALPEQVLNILQDNNISTIGELCGKRTTELKSIGIENKTVNKINTELQLLGLGLKNSL